MTTEYLQIISDLNTRLKRLEAKVKILEGVESKRLKIPTLEEVRAYCTERKNGVDPNKWYDFYTGKGWMVGKNKMKDWNACIRTWEDKTSVQVSNAPSKDKLPDDYGKPSETSQTYAEYKANK